MTLDRLVTAAAAGFVVAAAVPFGLGVVAGVAEIYDFDWTLAAWGGPWAIAACCSCAVAGGALYRWRDRRRGRLGLF